MEAGRHKRSCGRGGGAIVRAVAAMSMAATLISCVSAAPKKQPPVDYARRIQKLQKQIKKKNQLIEDLKERNLVLESRAASRLSDKPTGIMYTESAVDAAPEAAKAAAAEAPATEPSQPLAPEPKIAQVPVGENAEHYLYSKIIDTYRAKNADELKTTLRLLLKTYPDSIFADNALFMAGLLAFETGDLASARMQFERLLEDYPRSNKVVSALFLKAEIDKRSGRKSDAIRGFKMVRDLFPGSPESFRVSVELKLLQGQASSKRRET